MAIYWQVRDAALCSSVTFSVMSRLLLSGSPKQVCYCKIPAPFCNSNTIFWPWLPRSNLLFIYVFILGFPISCSRLATIGALSFCIPFYRVYALSPIHQLIFSPIHIWSYTSYNILLLCLFSCLHPSPLHPAAQCVHHPLSDRGITSHGRLAGWPCLALPGILEAARLIHLAWLAAETSAILITKMMYFNPANSIQMWKAVII